MPIHLVVGQKATGDDFFDREALMDSLWTCLPRQSVELIAPRRFGKSSVMQRLGDYPRKGCRVVLIDCEAFAHPQEVVQALAAAVAPLDAAGRAAQKLDGARRGIQGALGRLRSGKVGPTGIEVNLADPSHSSWSVSVGSILQYARSHTGPTVVVLDEFSMMLENCLRHRRIEQSLAINLLTWLRRLRQQQGEDVALAFVIGGSISLQYWLRRLGVSAMMNDLQRLEVEPFDGSTAGGFVLALLESEHLRYEPTVPSAILREIAPALPYWIQALVLALAHDACRNRIVTPHDVSRLYREQILGPAGRQYFQPFDERLGNYDPAEANAARRLLTYLARDESVGSVPRETLATIYTQASGSEAPEAFDAVMADLESDFYVHYEEETKGYVFKHKVLRDWWLRWHGYSAEKMAGGTP